MAKITASDPVNNPAPPPQAQPQPTTPQPNPAMASQMPAPPPPPTPVAPPQPTPSPEAVAPPAPQLAPPPAPPAPPVASPPVPPQASPFVENVAAPQPPPPAPLNVAAPAPAQAAVPYETPMLPSVPSGLAERMESMLSGGAAPTEGGSGGGFDGIDLSKIDDSGFKVLDPKLEYEAIITKAAWEKAANTGNRMLSLTMKTTYPQGYTNVRIYDQCVVTPDSLWKLKSLLRATDGLDENGNAKPGFACSDIVDSIVRFGIKNEEYNNTTRNKVNTGYSEGRDTPGLPGAGVPSASGDPGAPAPQWGIPPTA